jgi:hypothetical protein
VRVTTTLRVAFDLFCVVCFQSVDVIVEQKYHAQLIGPKGSNVKSMIEQFGGISFKFPGSGETSDIIVLRGDKKNVEAAEKFLKTEVKRLAESNFTLEVPLFSQFVKHIIGRGGATLNLIKSETDTRIKIPKDASETTILTITGWFRLCTIRSSVLSLMFLQLLQSCGFQAHRRTAKPLVIKS